MKKLLSICLTSVFLLNCCIPVFAAEGEYQGADFTPNAKSAVLMERDTGTLLYAKNEDEQLPPASMTKIMTMILIMEALDHKQIKMSDKVRTSEYAASMGGSQIFLEPGETMTVKQMLYGISIGSANDASVAMAEKIAGSEEAFVDKMNTKAKQLGLKNTFFQNCTGLPVENHYSSARDMALMGKELLKHEEITKFTGTYESYLRENTDKKFWLVNTNKLVKFYPGVDGLKTGFTNESKYCLTATASRDGMRIVAVVFGADDPKSRNLQVTKLLDYGFNQFSTKQQFKKGENLALVNVEKGHQNKVKLQAAENITILTKKGEVAEKLTPQMTLNQNIQAPIHKGQVLGNIKIEKNGKIISKTDLVAAEDIQKATWFQSYQKALGMFTQVKK